MLPCTNISTTILLSQMKQIVQGHYNQGNSQRGYQKRNGWRNLITTNTTNQQKPKYLITMKNACHDLYNLRCIHEMSLWH